MQIKYLKLKDLKPYANNPRLNDDAVGTVANSIKEFGFINPIVIDKNNVVVAGHTRLKAAEMLGLEEAPTIMVDNLTEEQVNAFRIADNKVAEISQWDEKALWEELQKIENIDMESLGFNDSFYFEEEDPVFEDIENDPRESIDKEQKETMVKDGDIWQLGKHRLMCGSSTDEKAVKKLFKGDIADMVLTDPPYNVNYGEKAEALDPYNYTPSEKYIANDNMSNDQFVEFLNGAFKNMSDHLREGGAFYIFHASSTHYEFETALKENNLQTRQQLIWVKNSFVLGRQDYQWKHEPCLYGWKEGAGHYFIDDHTQSTIYEREEELEKMTREQLITAVKKARADLQAQTIIYENKPLRNELHPTMKPINLCVRLIRNSSKKEEIVYDAFAGSGSTLIACEQTGRKCYTIELDPHYCDVIIQRWETLTGKKAKKLTK